MKAKYILEALLLKGMKIVLDSAKEAFIVLQIHSNETFWVIFKHYKCTAILREEEKCVFWKSPYFLLVFWWRRRWGV